MNVFVVGTKQKLIEWSGELSKDLNLARSIFDLEKHISEIITFTLGYRPLSELKRTDLYDDVIQLYPRTDPVLDALRRVIRKMENWIGDITSEKVHYKFMYINTFMTDQLYFEICVFD